jgi:hypothetical protein
MPPTTGNAEMTDTTSLTASSVSRSVDTSSGEMPAVACLERGTGDGVSWCALVRRRLRERTRRSRAAELGDVGAMACTVASW